LFGNDQDVEQGSCCYQNDGLLSRTGKGVWCLIILISLFTLSSIVFAQDLDALKAGVVKITANPSGGSRQIGTGFIVSIQREVVYVVTAAHVVAGDQYPFVEFFGTRGKKVNAEVQEGSELGDEERGLALLTVREMGNLPEDLTILGLSQDVVQVKSGEPMAVIGLPRAAGDWAVIHGHMVSRRGRDLKFDVRIDQGASGGPVMHNKQVVGLVQSISTYAQGNSADSIRVFLQGFGITPPAFPTVHTFPSGLGISSRGVLPNSITGKDGASMVLVLSGEFMMGSPAGEGDVDPNEQPQHLVILHDYYIDQYEVTVEQYARFLNATGIIPPRYWEQGNLPQHGQKPVVGIHWEDAHRYCQWVGKRLPTEAEWEKAARGTDNWPYPWGTAEPESNLANFGQSESEQFYADRLTPVGKYEQGKSPYGAYDMAGNVWEWVADWYSEEYYQESPKKNPKGPSDGDRKVLRGGSWDNGARNIRSANRSRKGFPTRRQETIGVRCAKDVP
jgi:formylglycine-generating enzyme required for sulfatase activity